MNMNLDERKYLDKELRKIQKLYETRKYNDVIIKSRSLLKKFPRVIPLYNAIALSMKEIRNFDEAEKTLLRALEIDSEEQSLLSNLGLIFKSQKKYEEANKYFLKALSINSQNIIVLINFGNLKKDLKQFNEAIEFYKKALSINENSFEAHLNLADTYKILGNFNLCLKHCSFLNLKYPHIIEADQIMSEIVDYSKDDTHQKHMIKKLEELNLTNNNKIILNFAVAKSYEDQKIYNKAIKFFDVGNELKYNSFENYNFQYEINLFEFIKKNFIKIKNKLKSEKIFEKKIIFILGLPRSGTTLIHQILAQNEDVFGAGELVFFSKYFKVFSSKNFEEDNFLNNVSNIRASFLKRLIQIKSEKDIVLEKTPDNFIWLGFLKIIFPNCKIINCQRNSKDVALSLYKKLFSNNSYIWSYNKVTLIKYLKFYKDVIKFWDEQFGNEIFHNNYSELIANPEHQSKKIFKFCDLSWKDDFIKIENSKKPIETLSYVQARKPIYKSALNSHSVYMELTDLFDNLE